MDIGLKLHFCLRSGLVLLVCAVYFLAAVSGLKALYRVSVLGNDWVAETRLINEAHYES